MLRIDATEPLTLGLRLVAGAAGVDEAGRGTLAGPVVAAAVILPEGFDLKGVDDSKRLTAFQRRHVAQRIREQAVWSLGMVDAAGVDRLNILQATLTAMREAVDGLPSVPATVLVDGDRVPAHMEQARAIVGGDRRYACIAAASILAKVTRDELMTELAAQYPRWGFHRHFGYATPDHLTALRTHGPSPIHRRTFAPVRDLVNQPCLPMDD